MEEMRQSRDEIDLHKIILLLWRKRNLTGTIVLFFTALGFLYAFILATPMYRSSITLYPADQEDSGNSQLRMMATQFGIGGLSGPNSYYNIPDVAKSRRVAKKILEHKWSTQKFPGEQTTLADYWEIDARDEWSLQEIALEKVRKQIVVGTNEETGLITISVLSEEPQLAADIVNFVGRAVTEYVQSEQKARSSKNIDFIVARISEIKEELSASEDHLLEFLEKNRTVSDSPVLTLELGRLQQQVAIKREVFITLEKQKELAQIERVKDTPVINMLDSGEKAIRRFKPNRKLIVLSMFLASLVLGVIVSLFTEHLRTTIQQESRQKNPDWRARPV